MTRRASSGRARAGGIPCARQQGVALQREPTRHHGLPLSPWRMSTNRSSSSPCPGSTRARRPALSSSRYRRKHLARRLFGDDQDVEQGSELRGTRDVRRCVDDREGRLGVVGFDIENPVGETRHEVARGAERDSPAFGRNSRRSRWRRAGSAIDAAVGLVEDEQLGLMDRGGRQSELLLPPPGREKAARMRRYSSSPVSVSCCSMRASRVARRRKQRFAANSRFSTTESSS